MMMSHKYAYILSIYYFFGVIIKLTDDSLWVFFILKKCQNNCGLSSKKVNKVFFVDAIVCVTIGSYRLREDVISSKNDA